MVRIWMNHYILKKIVKNISTVDYAFMWIGDGVNLGNMTLGASLIVAGLATLNIWQTFAAAIIAIGIISTVFALNDRVGYRTGIPYVVQLRMSFGRKAPSYHHFYVVSRLSFGTDSKVGLVVRP